MRLPAVLVLLVLAPSLVALELGWAREPHVVIDGVSVRAIVPARAADAIAAEVRLADRLYRALAADAGYEIERPLWLWFGRDSDLHNGFSTVIPFPLIQVELAPARPDQRIFAGGNDTERTLVHELTHHIANDRNQGFRAVMQAIFGRVIPSDPLSLIVAYLTLPPHVFQPGFWHEGIAVWAETAYAAPDTPWGGRGRDPLVHLQWRLDVAGPGIPPVGDWRATYPRWPYGGQIYLYGTAYLRYLVGAYDIDPWELIAHQARKWPYIFNNGPTRLYGKPHDELIPEAMAALEAEQRAVIERLSTVPFTPTPRLTPEESAAGAPAWTHDGRIALTLNDRYHRPRLHLVGPAGELERRDVPGHFTPDLRATPEGQLVGTCYDYRGRATTLVVAPDGGTVELASAGVLPDLRTGPDGWILATVALDEQLEQRLRLERYGKKLGHGRPLEAPPQRGEASWSPAWRPGKAPTLVWVETHDAGSTLVLATLDQPDSRRELLTLPGRILHPAWTADGQRLFFAADHSGVPNAYRLDLAGDEPALRQVTHVLGGVIAAVPSPDGSELALIDHDADGPHLARIPLDESTWPREQVAIECRWPAPVAATPARHAVRTLERPAADAPEEPLPQRPYRGLALLRPRYWTPTTAPVPSGGFGAIGVLTDPLTTHVVVASAGVGPVESEFVGLASWTYRGWPLDVGITAWRSELTFSDEVVTAEPREYDYTETRNSAELLLGRGIAALDRGFFGFVRLGVSEWEAVDEATAEYANETVLTIAPFEGEERYVQLDLGYDDRFLFPDGFAPDAGVGALLSLRHSGFEGELERNRVELALSGTLPIYRPWSHQLHLAARGGWSDGDRFLQGSFAIGGAFGLGLPRGYVDRVAAGRHLVGGSVAYRFPLWRPFEGFGSDPFVQRQLVLEAFFDAAKVSSDEPLGDGDWFRSYGGILYTTWEFDNLLLQPGLGIAQQLDGEEDTSLLFELGFRY